MLFKELYRKYKADEARKKFMFAENNSVETAPSSPASSSGSERESQYFDFTQLKKVYDELDGLTAHIDQLKKSICLLRKNSDAESEIYYQASLVRAFENERNAYSLQELNEPYASPTKNSIIT